MRGYIMKRASLRGRYQTRLRNNEVHVHFGQLLPAFGYLGDIADSGYKQKSLLTVGHKEIGF
jgi:hypothetical protein